MFGFVTGYADVVMEGKKGRPLSEVELHHMNVMCLSLSVSPVQ